MAYEADLTPRLHVHAEPRSQPAGVPEPRHQRAVAPRVASRQRAGQAGAAGQAEHLADRRCSASSSTGCAATPDGDGTLLDHSLILWGSGMSDSNAHSPLDVPYLMAGKGGGRFKGNRHLAAAKGDAAGQRDADRGAEVRRRDRSLRRQHRGLRAVSRRLSAAGTAAGVRAGQSASRPRDNPAVPGRGGQAGGSRGGAGAAGARATEVNRPEPDGTTALHWAVRADDAEAGRPCCCAPAPSVKAANRYGVQPLTLAATNGDAGIIERLLKAGADPNTATAEGETVLMTAARTGKRRGGEGADCPRRRRQRARALVRRDGADVGGRRKPRRRGPRAGRGGRRRQRAVGRAGGAGAGVPAQRRAELAVSARRLDAADVSPRATARSMRRARWRSWARIWT